GERMVVRRDASVLDGLARLLVLNQHVVAELHQPRVRFDALTADHGQVAKDLVEGAVLFHDVNNVANLWHARRGWRRCTVDALDPNKSPVAAARRRLLKRSQVGIIVVSGGNRGERETVVSQNCSSVV